jgi:hypothetical protein
MPSCSRWSARAAGRPGKAGHRASIPARHRWSGKAGQHRQQGPPERRQRIPRLATRRFRRRSGQRGDRECGGQRSPRSRPSSRWPPSYTYGKPRALMALSSELSELARSCTTGVSDKDIRPHIPDQRADLTERLQHRRWIEAGVDQLELARFGSRAAAAVPQHLPKWTALPRRPCVRARRSRQSAARESARARARKIRG